LLHIYLKKFSELGNNCGQTSYNKEMIKVFEANNTVENKAKIPEPFTKPACINADAGVGAVIAESKTMERWINCRLNYSGRDAQTR
jgi:hypothetical protein